MRKWLVMAAAGFILAAASGAWVFLGEDGENMDLPEYKITFISPMANFGYWGNVAGGIVDTGEQHNIHVKCVGFSELNLEKQIYAMENAILSDVDGIVTVAYEASKEFQEVMELAEEAGIPVVFVDSYVKDMGQLCYVGSDNFSAGELAARTISEKCGGRGHVAIITSYKSNANQRERIAGFQESLKSYPDMQVVEILEGQSKAALLKEKITYMLEEQPQITAVFCSEGYGSSSMIHLLEKNERETSRLKMVLFDSSSMTEQLAAKADGAIVMQKPYEMGCQAVQALLAYYDGEKQIQNRYTDVKIFDGEDMGKAGYEKREDIQWHIY